MVLVTSVEKPHPVVGVDLYHRRRFGGFVVERDLGRILRHLHSVGAVVSLSLLHELVDLDVSLEHRLEARPDLVPRLLVLFGQGVVDLFHVEGVEGLSVEGGHDPGSENVQPVGAQNPAEHGKYPLAVGSDHRHLRVALVVDDFHSELPLETGEESHVARDARLRESPEVGNGHLREYPFGLPARRRPPSTDAATSRVILSTLSSSVLFL